nr:unnamed protein product [Digitaria exilis]
MPAITREVPASHASGKQSRPTLGFDLNVADDQALEEDVPQSSAQTTCSESELMKLQTMANLYQTLPTELRSQCYQQDRYLESSLMLA